MYIIPIGVDCGNVELLKSLNLRVFSFPFDWIVTYNGISNILKTNFSEFFNIDQKKFNEDYQLLFVHNTFPNDYDILNRRIKRFLNILSDSTDKIIFIRKGHATHHHKELNTYCTNCNIEIKDDIKDAEELYLYLKSNYSKLIFKIIVILVCGNCYNNNTNYSSIYEEIDIYNISAKRVESCEYTNICNTIFKKNNLI